MCGGFTPPLPTRAKDALRAQEQTALGTPEAGESIDQQKTLHCRTVFRHNQTLIQNGTRQLLRYGKSQCPSDTEKYLHESEKSSQQNLRGSTIKGSNPSKCGIRKNYPKKKEKTSLSTKMTCNNCHLDISLIKHNKFKKLCRGLTNVMLWQFSLYQGTLNISINPLYFH